MIEMKNSRTICAIALFLTPVLLRGQDLLVKLDPEQISLQAGGVCSVQVYIENVANLGSFQFDLSYQTDIIEVQGVERGDFLGKTGRNIIQAGPVIDNSSSTGEVRFGCASFGSAAGPDGSGVLAKVHLSAQAEGTTTLALVNMILSDIQGVQMQDINTKNGLITVTSEETSVPGSNEARNSAPRKFSLYDNYPNPFNPTTTIEYGLPQKCYVELTIIELSGRKVCTLVNGEISVGHHQATWSGLDDQGNSVASGVYIYCLKTEGYAESKRLLLLR